MLDGKSRNPNTAMAPNSSKKTKEGEGTRRKDNCTSAEEQEFQKASASFSFSCRLVNIRQVLNALDISLPSLALIPALFAALSGPAAQPLEQDGTMRGFWCFGHWFEACSRATAVKLVKIVVASG